MTLEINSFKVESPPFVSSIQLVQQKVQAIQSNQNSLDFDVAPTRGNTIIVCATSKVSDSINFAKLRVSGSPADNLNIAMDQSGTVYNVIYYFTNIPNGTTGVVLDTNNEYVIIMSISEWSGLNDAAPEDTNKTSGIDNSPVSSAVTPSSPSNLIIAMTSFLLDDYDSGPTNGFTRLTPTGVGSGGFSAWQEEAYLIQSTAIQKSTGWGLTGSFAWDSLAAAFGGT